MEMKKPLIALLAAASLGTANAGESKLKDVLAISNNPQEFEQNYKPTFDSVCRAYRQGFLKSKYELAIVQVTKFDNSTYIGKDVLLFTTHGATNREVSKLEFFYLCPKNTKK